MRFHNLRIWLANTLVGDRVSIEDTPYRRICQKIHDMKDIDLPQFNRVLGNMFEKRWLERTIEVTKMHKAFTRKNRQIARLKEKVKVAEAKGLRRAGEHHLHDCINISECLCEWGEFRKWCKDEAIKLEKKS